MRLMGMLPGVGEKSAKKYWDKLGGMFDGRRQSDRDSLSGILGAKAKPVWEQIASAFARAGDHLERGETGKAVEDFCEYFYANHLHREFEGEEADDRLDDIKELAAQIAASDTGLEGFLADVALMTNLDMRRNDPEADRVTLSTVHQAKGMEWPVVFVPWLTESMFPSQKAAEEGRMDEERRLFYVAVTRAKDHLYLFSPTIRKNPDGGMYPVNPSMFATEIPDSLVNRRRVQMSSMDYAGGGGLRGYSRPSRPPAQPLWKVTWRR